MKIVNPPTISDAPPGCEKERAAKAEEAEDTVARWETENAQAIEISNKELRQNGLWSERHRLF
jgi:post-segregation antitoxin (ccd killing protein)